MATHDYVIANASGAAVRADLNNALAAIVSNNSNATEPATTYAYMWWADTTNGQLKLRNAANDAWITIQELDGTMLLEDGTAAAPGLAFASDLDTGLYLAAANSLGFATDGTARAVIDSSGRLLVGASSASTIGSASANIHSEVTTARWTLASVRNTNDTLPAAISFAKTRGTTAGSVTTVQNNDGLGGIYFYGADGTDLGSLGAQITAEVDGTPGSNDMPGRLVFSTTADGASSPTERMRISNNGAITAAGIYNQLISGTTRDVYVQSNGVLGYISSTEASKGNINVLSDVDWLYQLQPKTFNYRVQDESGAFTDDLHSELEYGLIAEEVESIAPDLCFYDQTDNGQELRGVSYRKLITPLLAALQQANQRIEALEAEVAAIAALETRLVALEAN